MQREVLWSLRLGFSAKQADKIKTLGISPFFERAVAEPFDKKIPELLSDSPQSLADLKAIRQVVKNQDQDQLKEMVTKEIKTNVALKAWWLERMASAEFPLREKMTCFWHNHFVATYQKVKVNRWIFDHNMLLREHAFGNFKELTKKVIKSNAMVRYLDNNENRNGKLNENLSRELLELFTLGIGNYTEQDIKSGAKALAGLTPGETNAVYRRIFENNEEITYLGKTGHFKADDLVDIIFEQPAVPYRITRKILQWFIYDQPDEKLVTYYGDYFRAQDFEVKPLLAKIFSEEYSKNTAGVKIKDPLLYILQLRNELHVDNLDYRLTAAFLKQQGMDLFNQPNVKGWEGGRQWLTSQIYLQRNNVADFICSGRNPRSKIRFDQENEQVDGRPIKIGLDWNNNGNNKTIIDELAGRLLFATDDDLQRDMEQVLKYDFDPKSESASSAVMRLFSYIVKTPEFQLI